MGENLSSAIASGKKIQQRLYSTLKAACSLDKAVDGIASTLQILNKLQVIGDKAVAWIPYFKMIDFINLVAELGFASETTHKVRMLNKTLYSKENELDGKSDDEKLKILGKASEALKNIDVNKDLMIKKNVRLHEKKDKIDLKKRVVEIAKICSVSKPSSKEKEEAIKDGEKIVKGLKGRVRTTLTRNCLNLVNRIAIVVAGAFVTFPQFIFPLAVPILFPAGFVIFSCVGVLALALWGHKTFIISKDPFNKDSKVPLQKMVKKSKSPPTVVEKTPKAESSKREKIARLLSSKTPAPVPATAT
jgi:hypothetical protein